MLGAAPVPLQNRDGGGKWESCPGPQGHTKSRWSNNAHTMEFFHKAIPGRFSFSKLFDALYSILCVSVDLTLTFVYSLGMFII